jgi:hypothetical protein
MAEALFEWDAAKNQTNQQRHGVSFEEAQQAFLDPRRVIARDDNHSQSESRFYCLGHVRERILTVRYTMREQRIRIIGAGYWRKGRKAYEEANQIHG